MRALLPLLSLSVLASLAPGIAAASAGALDANGCHYDRAHGNRYHCHQDAAPNPDINAPVKKSRENICHDRNSSNYRMLRYFVAYRSMDACLSSGGEEARPGRGLSGR